MLYTASAVHDVFVDYMYMLLLTGSLPNTVVHHVVAALTEVRESAIDLRNGQLILPHPSISCVLFATRQSQQVDMLSVSDIIIHMQANDLSRIHQGCTSLYKVFRPCTEPEMLKLSRTFSEALGRVLRIGLSPRLKVLVSS